MVTEVRDRVANGVAARRWIKREPTAVIMQPTTLCNLDCVYAAATLYCTGLLQPKLAQGIHHTLVEFLAGPAGRIAMVAAAVRLRGFIDEGELIGLEDTLRQQIAGISR